MIYYLPYSYEPIRNAVCEYMNNNYKDLRATDIKQTISKSYKSIELFQKLKRF